MLDDVLWRWLVLKKSERWGLMERPIFNPCFLGQEFGQQIWSPCGLRKSAQSLGHFQKETMWISLITHSWRDVNEGKWIGMVLSPNGPESGLWIDHIRGILNTNLGLVKVVNPIIGVFCWTLLGYIYIYLHIHIFHTSSVCSFEVHRLGISRQCDDVYCDPFVVGFLECSYCLWGVPQAHGSSRRKTRSGYQQTCCPPRKRQKLGSVADNLLDASKSRLSKKN